ncbi:MAG: DUF1430 domain-containing protein [Lachnospiraceae bacterium]|nr:DUF1430 domain-containing protein [Lachnospiraceae bacterium]
MIVQKKLVIIVVALTMLFNVFFFLNISNSYIDNILLDKTRVSLRFTNDYVTSKNEVINKIVKFSKDNNLEIAQYSFLNSDKIDIYTTKKKEYKNIVFVPTIIFNREIKVHSFKEILNVGFKGELLISSKDKSTLKQFVELLKDDCTLSYEDTNSNNYNFSFVSFFSDNKNNSFFILSFFVFAFVLTLYFYYSISKKRYLIYKLWGYSNIRIYYMLNKPIYISLLLTIIVGNVLMSLVIYRNIFSPITLKIFTIMIKLNVISFLLICLLSIPLFFLFSSITNSRRIKGLKKVMIISYIARILALLLVIFLANQFFVQKEILREKSDSLKAWKNTQNLYNLFAGFSPKENLVKEDVLNKKFFEEYKELKNLNKEFMINTINYERPYFAKNSGPIDYNYKLNVKKEEDLYSPYGKNITVDRNYLQKHTIKLLNGKNALSRINYDDNVLNILVPLKYKKFENVIKKSFRDEFYFQKVDVANIYREAKGQKKIKSNINDLKINIIYINNNLNIFTYNTNSGDGSNIIKDAIITVYTENVDNSFLLSCFGNYLFIQSNNAYSAMKEISVIAQKYNIVELNSIVSVYDKKGEEIRIIEQNIKNLVFNTIILSLILVMFMVVIIYTYYKTYFSDIIIKSFHGYSFWQIYKTLIYRNVVLNVLILFIADILYQKITFYMVGIICIMSILDCLISWVVNRYLTKKGEMHVLKREQ